MLESADYIAIVEFQNSERGKFTGLASRPRGENKKTKQWFSRRVTAHVIDELKGNLPEKIQIHDGSGHWDILFQNHRDRSKSDSGRYLIFLAGDVNFLTGANGWASTARIEDGKIEWTNTASATDIHLVDFEEVVNRMKRQIEQK